MTSYFIFQVTLKEMFPSWEDVKKHEEVVVFTCGLMESPEPLVDHVYELYKEREITWVRTNTWDKQKERHLASLGINVLDRRLYDSLYAESRVPLPGTPFHNHHVNHFNKKGNNEDPRITVLSKVYWFKNTKKNLVLEICQDIKWDKNQVIKLQTDKDINQGSKEDVAMIGIENPARELTKGLFSTWRKLSELQPVTDLFMKEVRSKDLTEQEVPMLSKNVHSLWVIDCEFPRLFWRNILQQLIGCPTLQLLWLQETNVNEVEEDLDRLLENIMAHYKEQVTVTQHQRDIQFTHYQRELTLFIQNKMSEQFKKKWRDHCTNTNIKCDIK